MITQATVTERDLRRLLQVVEEAELATDEMFPPSVLVDLHHLIPATEMTFQQMRWRARRTLEASGLSVAPDGGMHVDTEMHEDFWSAFWAYGGCSYPMDTGDYTSVLRETDDDLSANERARTAMGQLTQDRLPEHQVCMSLPPQGDLDRRLLICREEDPGFSDREVLLLRILRPHLVELHDRHQRLLRGQPELTPRQWEILRLVAAGDSNAQVARTLHVSQATVRKHLENIFQRLDVASRTEAAARARPFLDFVV